MNNIHPSDIPLAHTRKWQIFLAIGIGTLMSALDGSVVNTILPVIREYYGATVANVEWIVVIYLLVVSGLLFSFGRYGDLHGHKNVYILGFIIFIVSSALCGLAPSIWFLIGARGVQAVGAAMLFANSPAILTGSFPSEQRGRVLGMQATMTYIGLAVGPSLGGFLTHVFGWRTVFYINVPIGSLAFLLSLLYIEKKIPEKTPGEKFDWLGALLFGTGLCALLLGLDQGEAWGWRSPATILCCSIAVLVLAVFVITEIRSRSPLVDLNLFKSRIFSASTISALINYISLFFVMFIMPFYLIQGRGYSPARAGIILTPLPLVMAIAAPVSGYLSDRIGSRFLSSLGMAILGIGLFLLSTIKPDSADITIVLLLALTGLGTGIFISPNNNALMGSAPRWRQGIAASILATARNVGMVLGVGLSGAILASIMHGGGKEPLFDAVRISFIVGGSIAGAGVLVSLVRGKVKKG
jgi:EmrB/QacA subfamily drug resistance transporter